ncbi:MAG TPA: hypothetical protein VJH97_07335 [Candidatus Nanoarchaeia archaeon]|nr:hypothetical protein [Candidatus Nanoarchaeia archaeon]
MTKPTLEACLRFHEEQDPDKRQLPILIPGLNTYAYGINREAKEKGFIDQDRMSLQEIESELFLPQIEAGILQVELAEDIFEKTDEPGIFKGLDFNGYFPQWLQQRVDLINRLAERHNLKIQSTGTGQFLYTRMLAIAKTGCMELGESDSEAVMRTFDNLIKLANAVGARIVGGHRVMTAKPDEHAKMYSIDHFAREFGWDLPTTVKIRDITEAEAYNIAMAIRLNKNRFGISNTTELMYQHYGMAPVGVDQMNRMHSIIQANSRCQVYAHMDIGHVAVGAGGPKQRRDYNLREYGTEVVWPAWVVHFNSLYDNAHGMPTAENVAKDLRVRDGQETTKKSPHPDLYCDVYRDWLVPTAERTRVMQLTPEPKDTKDVSRLVREAKETYRLIQEQFAATHTDVQGYLVPNGMLKAFKERFVL